ncbi:MAG: hypothetical protein ACOC8I_04020 [Desulfosalsimonas sp.]
MLTSKNIHALMAGFFVFLVLSMVYHRDPVFAGSALGHGIGIAGTILILMTLVYPFRKRIMKRKGRQNPLNTHITYGLVGPSLVVIHSAHKYESIIGSLLFLALLVVVLSGIIGRFLYRMVNRSVREQKADLKLMKTRFDGRNYESKEHYNRLLEEAGTIAELEYAVRFFDRLKRMFSWWIQAHYLLSGFLFALIIVHVLTVLYYGLRWLP